MKIYKIVNALCLLVVFWNTPVLAADSLSSNEQHSAYKDYYGMVSGVYIEDSRLVINDFSLNYSHASRFYKSSGAQIADINNELKPGTAVKYHFYKTTSGILLKDLKIISQREFDNSQNDSSERY